jgi:predicted dehydrogenase
MDSLLVLGCGSIGKRHIGNFKALGIPNIVAVDPRPDRREEVKSRFGLTAVYTTVEQALHEDLHAAVICTPTSMHVQPAIELARRGIHLMIEKPISHNLEGVDDLLKTCHERSLVCFVAYVMRFYPPLATVKRLLDGGGIGTVLSIRTENSSYLPDWHPWEDYRSFYMAKKDEGGGAILDESHTLDYMRWFFGEADRVYAFNGKISTLEIDSDDLAEMVVSFRSGAVGAIHLDLLGRVPRKNLEVIGSEGTLLWDWDGHEVRLFRAATKSWERFSHDVSDYNQVYIAESRHFLDCVRGAATPLISGEDGKRTLQLVLAAIESSRLERAVPVHS